MSSCLASSATQPVTLSKPTTRLRGGPSLPRRQPQHCTTQAVRAKPRPFLSVHPVSIQQPSAAAQRHCRLPNLRRPVAAAAVLPMLLRPPAILNGMPRRGAPIGAPPTDGPRRAAPARPVERPAVRQPAACCLRSPQSHPVSPPLLSLMISISISVHCTPDAGGGAAPAGAACLLRPCTLTPPPPLV